MRRLWKWVSLGWIAWAAAASESGAQGFPAIADRGYAIDLYQGTIYGSSRLIGVAGAAIASAEGSDGALVNPAALAVRGATSQGSDWFWHFDWVSPIGRADTDNNGLREEPNSYGFSQLTAGIAFQRPRFGVGFNIAGSLREFNSLDGLHETNLLWAEIGSAVNAVDEQLSVGLALRFASFLLEDQGAELFSADESAVHGGIILKPATLNMRAGLTAMVPLGDNALEENCDPLDCQGHILPKSAELPWRVGVGTAWRFAKSAWSSKVGTRFRDEKYVIVEGNLVLTGSVDAGAGIEAFGDMQLQPSGRQANFSLRLGSEAEWIPGWLRVRGGSYFEPSRFKDPAGAAIPGRPHVTAGMEVRLFSFRMFESEYRVRMAVSADVADDYVNVSFSPGLWQ